MIPEFHPNANKLAVVETSRLIYFPKDCPYTKSSLVTPLYLKNDNLP